MTSFPLKIITPDGIQFEGQAQELIVRTTSGDTGIMAGHTNYVAPLGMGQATVITDGQTRYAACIGGMVSVVNGDVTLLPTTLSGRNGSIWSALKCLRRRQIVFFQTRHPLLRIFCLPRHD